MVGSIATVTKLIVQLPINLIVRFLITSGATK